MKFDDLKIEKDKNIRMSLGPKHGIDSIASLADAITAEGLLVPLLVKLDGTIIAGHRRYAAIQLIRERATSLGERPLPFEDVAVTVRELDDDRRRIVVQLMENGERRSVRIWEQISAIHDLRRTGLTQAEVSDRVKLSKQTVSHYCFIMEHVSPDVRKMLDDGLEIPFQILYDTVHISPDDQKKAIQQWLDPKARKARKKPTEDEGKSAKRRRATRGLRILLVDLEATQSPKWKVATALLRYLLGDTDTRPVPLKKSSAAAVRKATENPETDLEIQ